MKVGIDISQIAYRGSGVATYTENLVKHLLEIDKENEYILFFSSLRQKPPENFKSNNFKLPPILLEFLWNRLHILPIEKFVGKVDVFHTSDWLEPPAKCPKITTIHDLAIFKYPQTFAPKGGHNIVKNMRRKLELVKKDGDFVIAVSQSTKRDIVEMLDIPPEKITVIYEAVDETVNSNLKSRAAGKAFGDARQISKIEETKKKYHIEGDYILSVGTQEPRKNLKRLVEAFSLLTHNSELITYNLVIAGNLGWGEELKPVKNVLLTGFVPQEDLPYLYAGATIFVYPSLYEGFGLPVLEAMASGVPIVCSNTSSLPEIAGEAAVYVDPENTEDIKNAIETVIADQKLRDELSKKGILQAKKFSWQKTAEETLNVYRKLYNKP